MQKVLNDPELLIERLNEHGTLIDEGEELNYSIGEQDGKRVVELNKTAHKNPNSPKKEPSISKKVKRGPTTRRKIKRR